MNIANSSLYSAILTRRSVRKYIPQPLSREDWEWVDKVIENSKPLVSSNQFHISTMETISDESHLKLLGVYGRLINPPYYLIPSISGDRFLLTDLGFRMQQITVQLWLKRIGTCYIGCLSRESEILGILDLPDKARIGAFLVFGHPSGGIGFQTLASITHLLDGRNHRQPFHKIFYLDSWENPANPPGEIIELMQAARMAPSAVNAQPWRFVLKDRDLFIFVVRNYFKYLLPSNENYCFYDGGICLANLDMALSALNLKGSWQMLDSNKCYISNTPHTHFALAKLSLEKGLN
jgi:hypothetical protein